ncbi:MBL fold metallo-hydrolase [Thermosediminibacter litoriperuensis]|uniref:MBL fold metallo-hydrolase n=1 Tax=Thermosediminibacter litoriperuensis TaxID=291989 RepID=UPI0014781374|nr:MBL fold metallo-hydrolase [Thermosediminibacter litoriperuensis]
MKLNRIGDNVYCIDAAVNMGLITGDGGEALLVDAGIDDSVSRKVKRIIEENGFKLKGIIITHAHADHCGGAPHLVKTTGARVFSNAYEKTVLEFPIWEPVYLFSGAYPPAPLRNKFLLAPGVKVDGVLEAGVQTPEGFEVEILDLSGHTPGQIGVAAGGVLFCADSVIAPGYIEKHGVPLNADIKKALKTLDLLEERSEGFFVPSHGDPVENIRPVVSANRKRILETVEYVMESLREPRTAEEVLAGVCDRFGIVMGNMTQYYLMNLTVMAYIGYLLDEGEITNFYESGRQFFRVKTA